jgi:hypothetical protein
VPLDAVRTAAAARVEAWELPRHWREMEGEWPSEVTAMREIFVRKS